MVAAGAGKSTEGDAETCREAIASGKARSKAAAKPPMPAGARAQYDEHTPGPAAGPECERDGRRGGAPRPRGLSAPDPDMAAAVERQISDRGRFAGRSELLAALHTGIDPAGLDRVLEHLEHSAKISTAGGAIRWTLDGDGPRDASSAGEGGGSRSQPAAVAAGEPAHILSMAERLSADLDNDRPYNKDIERRIADCEAGRPIGRTYTAEEYMRHLEQEHGIGATERPE